MKNIGLVIFIAVIISACNTQEIALPDLDTGLIENITGITGTLINGEYKIAIPQSNLTVSVDGFEIIPPMGLTSWAGFTPSAAGAMVMGDFVVLEDEVEAVEEVVITGGLNITALHNHFIRDDPKVMFMHIHGMGPTEDLARGVRGVIEKVKELREEKGLMDQTKNVDSSFETQTIDTILGHIGSYNSGVYKVTVGRPDVSLTDHDVKVSTFLGFNTWMAFQGSDDNAAVAGDFVMLANEIEPVIKALVSNGIEVVALHNHMVNEIPRVFFLHFWGVGSVEELANALKSGLDQTKGTR